MEFSNGAAAATDATGGTQLRHAMNDKNQIFTGLWWFCCWLSPSPPLAPPPRRRPPPLPPASPFLPPLLLLFLALLLLLTPLPTPPPHALLLFAHLPHPIPLPHKLLPTRCNWRFSPHTEEDRRPTEAATRTRRIGAISGAPSANPRRAPGHPLSSARFSATPLLNQHARRFRRTYSLALGHSWEI
jgi:hypothetical protein